MPCNTCGAPWRKATPEIDDVYKDADFEGLRKDTRFAQLMASRPPAIPE